MCAVRGGDLVDDLLDRAKDFLPFAGLFVGAVVWVVRTAWSLSRELRDMQVRIRRCEVALELDKDVA